MSQRILGTIASSGFGAGVQAPLFTASSQDGMLNIQLSGTYTGLTLTFQGTCDATPTVGGNWGNITVLDVSSNTFTAGGTAISPSNSSTRLFQVSLNGLTGVAMNVSALSTGNVAVVSQSQTGAGGGGGATTSVALNTAGATTTITSTSANALAVGANGATNPVLNVNASTGSVATGISVVGAAAASGVAVQVITSGTNEALTIDAAAAALVKIGTVAATAQGLQVGSSTSAANAQLIVQSTNAAAFVVGRLGATTPAFKVNSNAATSITGVSVTSNSTGNGVAVAAIGEAANGNLTIDAQGSGTITLQGTATGNVVLGDAINIAVNATTGTKIGTATTQKLALWNATPIVQPANTVDYVTGLVNVGLRASGGTAAATFPGAVVSTGTGGIGYATGAGGTVTQMVSKSTGVTLSKTTGQITMNNAALNANTIVSFTLTNTTIAATDILVMNHVSGGTVGSYLFGAQCGAGSAVINVTNITAGNLSEAVVIGYVLVKGANS